MSATATTEEGLTPIERIALTAMVEYSNESGFSFDNEDFRRVSEDLRLLPVGATRNEIIVAVADAIRKLTGPRT